MTPRLVACAIALSVPAWAQSPVCPEQKLASPNGPGVRVSADCTREEGTFSNGRLWGQGKFTRNGIVYEGRFIDGQLNGPGRITYPAPDQRWHEGLFHNGYPEGPGRALDAHGVIRNGLFHQGVLTGGALLIFPNGGRMLGEYRSTGGIGMHLAIFPDGTQEVGAAKALWAKVFWSKPAASAAATKPGK